MNSFWQRFPAILTGLGLALVPISMLGMTFPVLGLEILVVAAAYVIILHLKERNLKLGSKYIYIPLAVITVLALLSSGDLTSKLLSIALFAIYLAAVNTKDVKLLGLGVVIGCISVVASSLIGGVRSGGMYQSYNVAVGAIVIGTIMYKSKYQWVLMTIALVGLLFTGAEEALVVIVALGLTGLIRRDWSRKLLLPVLVIGLILFAGTLTGATSQLWHTTPTKLEALALGDVDAALGGRMPSYATALEDIRPLGHGYDPYNFDYTSIHNVPLRALYELGPLAVVAWLFLMGYGLVKIKPKYTFAALIALSLFDHFLWTFLCTYQFAAIGLASSSNNDLVFRSEESHE